MTTDDSLPDVPGNPPAGAEPLGEQSTHSRRPHAWTIISVLLVGLLAVTTWSITVALSARDNVRDLKNSVEQLRVVSETTDAPATQDDRLAPPADLDALIKSVSETIVGITCSDSGGTGFSFGIENSVPGYQSVIVTNFHVIEECWDSGSEVVVAYGTDLEQEVVGSITAVDDVNDLAIIDIEPEVPELPVSEDFAERGWWTMAMGNPYDASLEVVLYRSVTFGHISYVYDGYWNYTSATLNPGNSGGPLVNSRGELIGINSFAAAATETGVWNIVVDSAVLCEELITCE